jgi:hypothetical protein
MLTIGLFILADTVRLHGDPAQDRLLVYSSAFKPPGPLGVDGAPYVHRYDLTHAGHGTSLPR